MSGKLSSRKSWDWGEKTLRGHFYIISGSGTCSTWATHCNTRAPTFAERRFTWGALIPHKNNAYHPQSRLVRRPVLWGEGGPVAKIAKRGKIRTFQNLPPEVWWTHPTDMVLKNTVNVRYMWVSAPGSVKTWRKVGPVPVSAHKMINISLDIERRTYYASFGDEG